jgi:hypothetical protein
LFVCRDSVTSTQKQENELPRSLTLTLSDGSEVGPSICSTINTLPFIATVIDHNAGQPTTNPVNVHHVSKLITTSGLDHGGSTSGYLLSVFRAQTLARHAVVISVQGLHAAAREVEVRFVA